MNLDLKNQVSNVNFYLFNWLLSYYKSLLFVEVPTEWLRMWLAAKPKKEFDLPKPNIYLTTDFSILPPDTVHPEYPEKILNTPLLELFYRKDQKFHMPYAFYYYYFISPIVLESAYKLVLMIPCRCYANS